MTLDPKDTKGVKYRAPRSDKDERPEVVDLFEKLKLNAGPFERLLERCNIDKADAIYRFYHQSFKVYRLQNLTEEIVAALQSLRPIQPLNKWFMQIVAEGTGKKFSVSHNARWLEETRSIVEAFFHSSYFLEMAVNSARELTEPPSLLPSSWAAFLYLYELR
jgi:hypothetical protein